MAEARKVADEQGIVADRNVAQGMTRFGHQPRVQRPGRAYALEYVRRRGG